MKHCFLALILILASWQCYAQTHSVRVKDTPLSSDLFLPISSKNVKIKGEIGRRIDATIRNNILTVDTDTEFILPFKKKEVTHGFVGIGMFIDAITKLAAYTREDKIISKKDHLVSELIDAQLKDGYIGMCNPESRMWNLWDVHEMAYIIYGLATNYEIFKDKKSLDAAIKAANYILDNWSSMPEGWDKKIRVSLFESVTGIDRAMLALYRHTREQRFLDFCKNERDLENWNLEIVQGRWPSLDGHVYGYLGMCLAQLEMYGLSPKEQFLKQTEKAMNFLTEGNGMVISGGAGQWEMWNCDQQADDALGETCASAYQVRTYEKLFRFSGEAKYGDLMERTIYNALFAAQSPDGRKIRYFTPMKGDREYFDKNTYCCPNNYRRIISELPSMVYYQSQKDGICINLYTESSAEITLTNGTTVKLEQQTDYPKKGQVKVLVSVSSPAMFPLQFRIPSWSNEVNLSVNGEAQKVAINKNGFVTINREWSKNDTVLLNMPMDWRFVKGRERQAGRVAVMRGPVLFCLNPENNQGQGLDEMTINEIGRIILDPTSLQAPQENQNSLQKNDLICKIGAWKKGWGMCDEAHDMKLVLTEFSDPKGVAVYFNISDRAIQVKDELTEMKHEF